MDKFSILIFLTVFCSVEINAAATVSCPTAQAVANFNASGFSGRWYFVERYFAVNTKVNLNIKEPVAVLNGNCSFLNLIFNNKSHSIHIDFATILQGKAVTQGVDDPNSDASISWDLSIGACKIRCQTIVTVSVSSLF